MQTQSFEDNRRIFRENLTLILQVKVGLRRGVEKLGQFYAKRFVSSQKL